jgi:hypothetical protein
LESSVADQLKSIHVGSDLQHHSEFDGFLQRYMANKSVSSVNRRVFYRILIDEAVKQ